MKRICKKCGVEKDIEEFGVNKRLMYGRSYACRLCLNKYVKLIRKSHKPKRKTILNICFQCGKEYQARVDGSKKFCSLECVHRSQNKQIEVICEWCGVKFKIGRRRIKKGRGKYCSKGCLYKALKGKSLSNSGQFKKGHEPYNYNTPKIELKDNKRTCKECGSEKDISEFSKASDYVYGRQYICKMCTTKKSVACYMSKPFEERSKRIVPLLTEEQKEENKKFSCKKWILKLPDAYVKACINGKKTKAENITPEMIDLKRDIIKFKRIEKELNNVINCR